jgi:hypothetical protein
MTPYPKGTLVKIEKMFLAGRLVNLSKDNLIGYITGIAGDDFNRDRDGIDSPLYQVYLFQQGRHHLAFHIYITVV